MVGADQTAQSDIGGWGGWSEHGLVGNESSASDLSFIGKPEIEG